MPSFLTAAGERSPSGDLETLSKPRFENMLLLGYYTPALRSQTDRAKLSSANHGGGTATQESRDIGLGT